MSGVRAQDVGEGELEHLRKKVKNLRKSVRRLKSQNKDGVHYGNISIFISPNGHRISVTIKKHQFIVRGIDRVKGGGTQIELERVEIPITQTHGRDEFSHVCGIGE